MAWLRPETLMRSWILSPVGDMVPMQNCDNKIHWTLINSRIVVVPKLALIISCLLEVTRKLYGNRTGSQFCTNSDAHLFSTKLNFMDEVLFSYFLKIWNAFFYGRFFPNELGVESMVYPFCSCDFRCLKPQDTRWVIRYAFPKRKWWDRNDLPEVTVYRLEKGTNN